MQLVTLTLKKVTYNLGYILPVWVGSTQQFVIIPTFDFRPPFMLLRMERCHLRMKDQAISYLQSGKTLPVLQRSKPVTIEPVHNIVLNEVV